MRLAFMAVIKLLKWINFSDHSVLGVLVAIELLADVFVKVRKVIIVLFEGSLGPS